MYGATAAALFQSNLYWLVDMMLMGALGLYFIYLWRLKTPGAAVVQISHVEQQWRVYSQTNQFETYQTVRVRFDFGWLMWLVFENQSMRKHVLLFQDQFNADDSRLFRVLLRVTV